jgi:transposase
VGRRKNGSKLHVITDTEGIPLAVGLTASNRHDLTQLIPLVEAIPPIAGKVGHPVQRPEEVFADRVYDSDPHREQLAQRGIESSIAERNTEHGSGLGVFRWVLERTISWLHQFRHLQIRHERRADIHPAIPKLGCIVTFHGYLTGSLC